jgi:hypothetical protein
MDKCTMEKSLRCKEDKTLSTDSTEMTSSALLVRGVLHIQESMRRTNVRPVTRRRRSQVEWMTITPQ